jgi:hypothetical protein
MTSSRVMKVRLQLLHLHPTHPHPIEQAQWGPRIASARWMGHPSFLLRVTRSPDLFCGGVFLMVNLWWFRVESWFVDGGLNANNAPRIPDLFFVGFSF